MKSGLLWYDNTSRQLGIKLEEAARRYQQKFGVAPDTAFVNPADYVEEAAPKNIKLAPKSTIMPNHIWLGVARSSAN